VLPSLNKVFTYLRTYLLRQKSFFSIFSNVEKYQRNNQMEIFLFHSSVALALSYYSDVFCFMVYSAFTGFVSLSVHLFTFC